MSRAKPSFTPEPRIWNKYQVAASFGRGEEWFAARRPELEKAGFPKYDALREGWDRDAVMTWHDRRSGLLPVGGIPAYNPWDEVLGNGA